MFFTPQTKVRSVLPNPNCQGWCNWKDGGRNTAGQDIELGVHFEVNKSLCGS